MATVQRESGLAALIRAMRSWRTAAVALLSFSSGLPLGLVWYAIPDWMRSIGVDLRVVGLFTLAQAPWAFKVLWSPIMDRYVPPFWGRRRGWIAVTQIALAATGLMMAGVGNRPEAIWVVGAIAFAIAMANAIAPTTQIASGCCPTPASTRPRAASASWHTAIHPRRRPQNGGT